jgi:D-glycero-D-manno-heptose 1,7-bisphosphate phosphatase
VKKAIFFDRDGILNHVVMRDSLPASPRSFDEFTLHSDAEMLVETAKSGGFLAIVVTNQPDISRNLMDPCELDRMHALLKQKLSVDDIEVATGGDDSDPRRKPNPGMLFDAAKKHDLALSECWMVGDSIKDVLAAQRAGVRSILLKTDYNTQYHDRGLFAFSSHSEIVRFLQNLSP